MKYDLRTLEGRLALIKDIESNENRLRKAKSLREYEIFNKRQKQFVIEHLRASYDWETVKEMPIIYSINLCNRIVKEQASIYTEEPTREFSNLNDDQKKQIQELYEEIDINTRLRSMNQYFKLQDQAHINFTVRKGKIKPRVLLPHQLDVIPSAEDSEIAEGYVISNFDKSEYLTDEAITATGYVGKTQSRGQTAAAIRKANTAKRFAVWTADLNFIMNGNGTVLSKKMDNPIAPIMPFVEATADKDFCYWVTSGSDVADFSIQFNAMYSDLQNVVKMQGWGQAVFVGTENQIPQKFVIGMNQVIRLPIDPSSEHVPDFKYVSASPDLQGSLQILITALSTFLSAAGVDPGSITTDGSSQDYASAIDRLLAKISEFEASKEDFSTFRTVEAKSYEIIKKMINTWGDTDYLETELSSLPDDSKCSVVYAEPQSLTTKKEDLELMEMRQKMGLTSRIRSYMEYYGVDRETAEAELKLIDEENAADKARNVTETAPTNSNQLPPPENPDGGEKDPEETDSLEGDEDGGPTGNNDQ